MHSRRHALAVFACIVAAAVLLVGVDYHGKWKVVSIEDEFIGGTGEVGEAGALGWSNTMVGVGAINIVNATANHPGIVSIVTGNAANDLTIMHLEPITLTAMQSTDMRHWAVLVDLATTVTNSRVVVGCGSDLSDASFGANSVTWRYDSSVGTDWRAVTRASSTDETVVSGINAVQGNWMLLEFDRDNSSGNWQAYINGSALGTAHTVRKPAVAMNCGFMVKALAVTDPDNLAIDWFELRSIPYTQRHT